MCDARAIMQSMPDKLTQNAKMYENISPNYRNNYRNYNCVFVTIYGVNNCVRHLGRINNYDKQYKINSHIIY